MGRYPTRNGFNGGRGTRKFRSDECYSAHDEMSNYGYKPGDTVYCLHCGGSFVAREARIHFCGGEGLLVCPNGDCNGSPGDWSSRPWS